MSLSPKMKLATIVASFELIASRSKSTPLFRRENKPRDFSLGAEFRVNMS
jgi:hypothetical protein